MKDQVITVVDAILLAKAELNAHFERGVNNGPGTVSRLEAILFDPKVDEAMGILVPGTKVPSIVPADEEHHSEDA